MDQPTNLEITIKGKAEEIKRAAFIAQRRIDLNTNGFDEGAYLYNDDQNFESRMDELIVLGSYNYYEPTDGMAEFETEQESYGCVEENDIKGIATDIIKVSPEVEIHISAVITITYEDGYDLCVDVDYVNGELNVETSEEYYEDEYDDDEDEDEDEE